MTDTLRPTNGNGYKIPPFEVADPEGAAERRAEAAAVDGWTVPKPALEPDLPAFPIDHLPKVLADMASAAAAEVQTPVDLAAMLALGVTAAAVAGKVEVVGRDGHTEQLPLWIFGAAESAERKTPVFNILRKPFTDYEQAHQRERMLERRKQEFKQKKLEAALAGLVKQAVKNGSVNQAVEENDLHEELEDLRIPPKLQLWVSSPTPEAVHNLLSENEGRMAVFSDEGGLFGIIAGRYAGKGGGADIDPFLQGYTGSPLRAPRVTAERKNVPAAFLTMGFAVQPKVLAELGAVEGVEDKGLIGRFLFSFPGSRIGHRPYRESVRMAQDIVDAYHATMTRLIEMDVPEERYQLLLDVDAFEAYADFSDRIEERSRKGHGDLGSIGSWAGKIAGTALRIAALFHLVSVDNPLEHPIDAVTISKAAAITEEYLIPHALAAFRVVRGTTDKPIRQRLVAWLCDKQPKEFTQRDAYQALKNGKSGRVQQVEDIAPSLEDLVEGGYIRRIEARRRDTVLFAVNPLWDFQ